MTKKKTTTTSKKAHSAAAHKAHHGTTAVAEPVAPIIDTPIIVNDPDPDTFSESQPEDSTSDSSMPGW